MGLVSDLYIYLKKKLIIVCHTKHVTKLKLKALQL